LENERGLLKKTMGTELKKSGAHGWEKCSVHVPMGLESVLK